MEFEKPPFGGMIELTLFAQIVFRFLKLFHDFDNGFSFLFVDVIKNPTYDRPTWQTTDKEEATKRDHPPNVSHPRMQGKFNNDE